jgi:hypothetical protein
MQAFTGTTARWLTPDPSKQTLGPIVVHFFIFGVCGCCQKNQQFEAKSGRSITFGRFFLLDQETPVV